MGDNLIEVLVPIGLYIDLILLILLPILLPMLLIRYNKLILNRNITILSGFIVGFTVPLIPFFLLFHISPNNMISLIQITGFLVVLYLLIFIFTMRVKNKKFRFLFGFAL